MISVVIDSSVLSPEHFPLGAIYRSLGLLGEMGAISLYIPKIVSEEFRSHLHIRYTKNIIKARSHTLQIHDQIIYEDAKSDKQGIIHLLEQLKDKIIAHVDQELEKWLNTKNFQVCEIEPEHPAKVFDRYFRGDHPFREAKFRNDIPDAFIWEIASSVATKSEGMVHFILADKRLYQSNSEMVFNSGIGDFIQTDEVQAILRDKIQEEVIRSMQDLILEDKNYIDSEVNSALLKALPGKTVYSNSFPGEENEGTIQLIDDADFIDYFYGDTTYYGDGIFVLPVTANVELGYYYYIYKADYWNLSETQQSNISVSENINDHYYEAEETFETKVDFKLAIKMELPEIEGILEEESDWKFNAFQKAEFWVEEIDQLDIFD